MKKTLATGAILALLSAQSLMADKIKVGLMLPYSGTFTALGVNIENGFRLFVNEQGGKLAGREIEFIKLDDESDPAKAADNATRLSQKDKVDVMVGTVHSGVALAMAKVAKDNNNLLIIPNAGADALTGALCDKNIFRASFSNWQPGYATGLMAAQKGAKKMMTLTWKYAAGDETVAGFKEAFTSKGGQVVKELSLPFPQVDFAPLITEIANTKPDALFVFFSGGAATKFLKDYIDAGLKDKIPLYASGFLTEGALVEGVNTDGIYTTLHYADNVDTPKDKAFEASYKKAYNNAIPDVFSVQGYDAAQLLNAGLVAVKGDISNRAGVVKGMEDAKIASPRGEFTMSKAHNPIQDFYIRKAKGTKNISEGTIVKALADPARGCTMQ